MHAACNTQPPASPELQNHKPRAGMDIWKARWEWQLWAWWIECYDSVSLGMDTLLCLSCCCTCAPTSRMAECRAYWSHCFLRNSRTRSLGRPYRATSKSSTHDKGNLYTPFFVSCARFICRYAYVMRISAYNICKYAYHICICEYIMHTSVPCTCVLEHACYTMTMHIML